MATVVIDIETAGQPWESLDDAQRTYLEKNARSDEERAKLPETLSLWPLTGKIIVVAKFELDAAKTKLMAQALAELKVNSAVIVISANNDTIERAARNLPKVKVLRVEGINVYDLLRHEHLILTQEALQQLEERLAA